MNLYLKDVSLDGLGWRTRFYLILFEILATFFHVKLIGDVSIRHFKLMPGDIPKYQLAKFIFENQDWSKDDYSAIRKEIDKL